MTHKLRHSFIIPGLAALGLVLAACDSGDQADEIITRDSDAGMSTSATESQSGVTGTSEYLSMIQTDVASEKGFVLGGVSLGNPDAPVTIIEYASLTCSHCATFDQTVLPEIKERYIASGKVRYVFYNFLLNRVDVAASSITRCFGTEKFFPLTDLYFSRQKEWLANAQDQTKLIDDMAAVARRAGISRTQFDQCLGERDLQQHLVGMASEGQSRWDITGTPTIIVNNKKRGPEALSVDGLVNIIEGEL